MNNRYWMVGHRVELPEMLYGREHRAARQGQIHQAYPGTLVCFTLNIAGPIKVFPLSEIIFDETVREIRDTLEMAGFTIRKEETDRCSYGWEAYYAVEGDAMEVKHALLALEEGRPAGRLFDIDVLRADGTKVSREDFGLEPRSCLICGKPTIACARSRTHTVQELQERTTEIFLQDIRERGCDRSSMIGILCRHACLLEVYTTPKPGLVDRNNNGSHKDMEVSTFEKSAAALEPYFAKCGSCGAEAAETGRMPEDILSVIRPEGILAEQAMYAATGGINTHKGMIFSLGILAAAAGYALASEDRITETERILEIAGRIASPAWEQDFKALADKDLRMLTAGEAQYRTFGIGGIRREAAEGFPSVREVAFPLLRQELFLGTDWQEAGAKALLALIRDVVDTNMIKRAGRARAEELRERAGEVLAEESTAQMPLMERILELDREFIDCQASPGGCADLLALTYFLVLLEGVH